jgi:hypothetical protein
VIWWHIYHKFIRSKYVSLLVVNNRSHSGRKDWMRCDVEDAISFSRFLTNSCIHSPSKHW